MDECPICLLCFKHNDEISLLNKCNHKFHSKCLEMWLSNHNICPLCRNTVETEFCILYGQRKKHSKLIFFYNYLIFKTKNKEIKYMYKDIIYLKIYNIKIQIILKLENSCFKNKKIINVYFLNQKNVRDFLIAYDRLTKGRQNLNYWEGTITKYNRT